MENQIKCKLCGHEISSDEDFLRIRPMELVQASKPPIYGCEACIKEKGGKQAMQDYLMEKFVKNTKLS